MYFTSNNDRQDCIKIRVFKKCDQPLPLQEAKKKSKFLDQTYFSKLGDFVFRCSDNETKIDQVIFKF
jgi:hypothetical protein